ncbi:uncharacterized protein PRCAT00004695001 [Priceomyces carsonii]|uniref:uncharacterized protein n=1 Tax=Priceomyces carsonii TaxID=28549 RepID=UPI002EDBA769|nr:unnamed protein product [Priceomyces carsonii]
MIEDLSSLLRAVTVDSKLDGDEYYDSVKRQRLEGERLTNYKSDGFILAERPWKNDPNYFKSVYISTLALMKMTIHANSGGSIEIMGMMTGKIMKNAIIVMDAYPLPVEGTETRVNAQLEGYEFMVQYLERSKQSGHEDNIVGWYHSHPGYGCWLSGIDVATQSLNQNFQDPYLAVVIDPVMTSQRGKVEIGAFRTYPDNYKPKNDANSVNRSQSISANVPKSKKQDFGPHSEKYYSLAIEIFKSETDEHVLDLIMKKDWISTLIEPNEIRKQRDVNLKQSLQNIIEGLSANEQEDQIAMRVVRANFIKKFNKLFEEEVQLKLLQSKPGESLQASEISSSADEDLDEDDEDDATRSGSEESTKDRLDMSDDEVSMDSTSVNKGEETLDRKKEFSFDVNPDDQKRTSYSSSEMTNQSKNEAFASRKTSRESAYRARFESRQRAGLKKHSNVRAADVLKKASTLSLMSAEDDIHSLIALDLQEKIFL